MALPNSKAYREIVKHLGPHGPDGLLAFVLFAGSSGLVAAGWEPWLTYGFAVTIFLLYAVRQTLREKHAERSAENAVRQRELEIGLERDRQKLKLAKEMAKLSPPNPVSKIGKRS